MDNIVKIADVAIFKSVNEVTGTGVGTVLYMAPEIFAAEIPDVRSDIYSFGLILWEMWYGKVAFSELGVISWKEFSKLIEKKHRRPTIFKEGVFPPIPTFESLMKKCWVTDQLVRLTADECVAQLDAILTRQTS
jgi:serine/threonine protein kinase